MWVAPRGFAGVSRRDHSGGPSVGVTRCLLAARPLSWASRDPLRHVYIDLMTRISDEAPDERAERLLADRTSFRLSADAWDEFVALLDRKARPNPKLAKVFAGRSET